jgi:hypothetical protein
MAKDGDTRGKSKARKRPTREAAKQMTLVAATIEQAMQLMHVAYRASASADDPETDEVTSKAVAMMRRIPLHQRVLGTIDPIDALASIDSRFDRLTNDHIAHWIERARKGHWGHLRVAAELALSVGAFDFEKRPDETPGSARERVKDDFEKAVKRSEKRVRTKGGTTRVPP